MGNVYIVKMPLVSMKKTSGNSKLFSVRVSTMDAELEFDVEVRGRKSNEVKKKEAEILYICCLLFFKISILFLSLYLTHHRHPHLDCE